LVEISTEADWRRRPIERRRRAEHIFELWDAYHDGYEKGFEEGFVEGSHDQPKEVLADKLIDSIQRLQTKLGRKVTPRSELSPLEVDVLLKLRIKLAIPRE
jgi:hypothetical protein